MKKQQTEKKTQKAEEIKNYPDAKIKCGCGNVFTVSSTQPEMEIEICSACHPYYTGQKKVVDIAGRVERFKERFEKFQKRTQKKSK